MTLHMVRLDPDAFKLARWGARHGLTRDGVDDGYLWHALLAAVFGEHAPKPFRVVERARGPAYLLGYCTADKATLSVHARAFADPAAAEAAGFDTLAVKQMPESFAGGQTFGFDVRVRPIVRTTRNDNRGKPGREIDAFLAAAGRMAAKPDRMEVYSEWLARMMGPCVALSDLSAEKMRRTRLLRRGAEDAEGKRLLRANGMKGGGPDVTLRGELAIRDPEAFATMLARGVGRHRAFGFGMLLLTPPGRVII